MTVAAHDGRSSLVVDRNFGRGVIWRAISLDSIRQEQKGVDAWSNETRDCNQIEPRRFRAIADADPLLLERSINGNNCRGRQRSIIHLSIPLSEPGSGS